MMNYSESPSMNPYFKQKRKNTAVTAKIIHTTRMNVEENQQVYLNVLTATT